MSRLWRIMVPVSTWAVFLTLIISTYFFTDRGVDVQARTATIESVPLELTSTSLPYGNAVRAASIAYGIPEVLIAAVITCESNWDSAASSRKGARGLMQVMPSTSQSVFGVHPHRLWEPWMNVHVGTAYLRVLSARFPGNARATLAAYNAGPGRASRNTGLPRETRSYLQCVERRYARYSRQLNYRIIEP